MARDYLLRDLGSTGGTYLNGARLVGDQPLRTGDVVSLGAGVTFTVKAERVTRASHNAAFSYPGATIDRIRAA